jgi:hypothetical protein
VGVMVTIGQKEVTQEHTRHSQYQGVFFSQQDQQHKHSCRQSEMHAALASSPLTLSICMHTRTRAPLTHSRELCVLELIQRQLALLAPGE